MKVRFRSSAVALLVVAASACASAPKPESSAGDVLGATAGCAEGAYQHLGGAGVAYGAAARRGLVVRLTPGGRPVERFGRLNPNGVSTVFGVLGRKVDASCRPAWYRVRLPKAPGGRIGWVAAQDVELRAVRTRIVVDLSARRVTLFRNGRRVLTTATAIGSPATPTPTGTFHVDQRLLVSDPSGPFGPGAIGIAAYSDVLTGWVQGGPIAIHGTNRPDTIGRAVSNGCLRIRNDVLRRLFRQVPEGTPVVIRA